MALCLARVAQQLVDDCSLGDTDIPTDNYNSLELLMTLGKQQQAKLLQCSTDTLTLQATQDSITVKIHII